MDEKTVAAGKSYTLYAFLCAIDEAKEGNYDKALQTGVVAVAGALVCLEEGDASCLDLLDEIICFMDRITNNHIDNASGEQTMLDALTMTLSGLDKLANKQEKRVNNAKVRYLYRAMIACEKTEKEALARTYERKAFSIIRYLRRNKALTCWLEYSKLYMRKSMSNATDTDAALRYAKKAYRIARRGCKKASVRYRNRCYKQMLESSGFLEYACDIFDQKNEMWKWRVCLLTSLLAWGVTNLLIALADFFSEVETAVSDFFKKYSWRILQLLYVAWLGWLVYIVLQQVFTRLM